MTSSFIKIILFLLLLALYCAFHPLSLCEAAVCYVKPIEPRNAACPGEPCYTLDEYVSNSTRYFVSNTLFKFLNGHHNLSNGLNVSDVNNIILESYIKKSSVIINSKLTHSRTTIIFKSASDSVIRDMTLQTIRIRYENSTNITLTGLRNENASIVLNNVFGAVNISNLTCTLYHCILLEGPVSQSHYIPSTLVILNELRVSNALNGVTVLGCIPGLIVLTNSTFYNSSHAINLHIDASCSKMMFVCEDTLFTLYTVGVDVRVQNLQQYDKIALEIALHNVSFINSTGNDMNLVNVHANISNCYFGHSNIQVDIAGSIAAINSILLLINNVTFFTNTNYNGGGAIYLYGNSRIFIPNPNSTYVLFEHNRACHLGGGAIYFSEPLAQETSYCRIFVEQIPKKTVLNFTNNWAFGGGNAIYGAYLSYPCYSPNGTLVHDISQRILNISSFFPPANFTDHHLQPAISSAPQDMCWCYNETCLTKQQGNSTFAQVSVYPGQMFGLSVATFGDMKGFAKTQVNAMIEAPDRLEDALQYHQATDSQQCKELIYTILSKNKVATLYLYPDTHQTYYNGGHFHTINLLECPLGFSLSTNNKCDCHERLLHNIKNIKCNITEQTIQRQGTTWIGVLENNTVLVFNNVCPFRYCNQSQVKLYINESFLNEHFQCNDNRSGILCGGCRDNYSLVLGSNRCLPGCNNNRLSLVIAFAATGIALVFFIKILNLTVSQGTINGLIFYANIVGAEQTVLISSKGFLSVFISWLNLNLGVETCFFDGMDAYTKAWLQFVFPVYVWFIALFIIVLSHYSIRASKLFGNNSVPVLATLILLSYSKLLQAVISSLSVTDLYFLNGSTMPVWERDGNIQYLTGKHIPLFIFAAAVLILLCFPFTLVLVSIQWLQRGTHCKALYWVTKLRPFFDAFTGPLKDRHRYWVGALLLVRCSLLLIFYTFTAHGSAVALVSISISIIILSVFLAATGSVYRNYYLTVLELSYILNLGIFANGTLYVQNFTNSGNQDTLATTSIGITFLQFMAIVIYHAYVQLKEPLKKLQFMATIATVLGEQLKKLKIILAKIQFNCQKDSQKDAENINEAKYMEYEPLDGESYGGHSVEQPTFSEVPNCREPLLELS